MRAVTSLLLFVLVVIPASSLHAVRATAAFLLVCALTVFYLSWGNIRRESLRVLLVSAALLAFLCAWLIHGLVSTPQFSRNHLQAFIAYLGVISVVGATLISFSQKLISFTDILKTTVVASFVYNSARLVLVMLPPLGILTVAELKDILLTVVGSITYGYWSADAVIARVSFGNDILTPFILATVLVNERLKKDLGPSVVTGFGLICILSGFLTFTRFIWVADVFVVLFYLMYVRRSTVVSMATALLLTLGVGMFIEIAWIQETALIRMGDLTSIDVKLSQSESLISRFLDAPLMGHGPGAYLEELVRSEYMPHNYEVQWAAILMQFGMFGTAVVLAALLAVVPWRLASGREKRYLVVVYLLWLMSGFTNPYLFILSSSIVYILFYCSFRDDLSLSINA